MATHKLGTFVCALFVIGCTANRNSTTADDAWRAASASITAAEMLAHISVLASDEFEGRAPGTPGESKTVSYLTEEFRRAGLLPGNPDGTWTQRVPATGFTSTSALTIRSGNVVRELARGSEFAARSRRLQADVRVDDSEIVFAGYGIDAPQYGWNDYKHFDARGKTLLMLEGEPKASGSETPEATRFRKTKASFFGTRTLKLDTAARKGAAAVLFVHEGETSRVSFAVAAAATEREGFDIASNAADQPVAVEGWITSSVFDQLCSGACGDLASLKKKASDERLEPVPLNARASFSVRNALRSFESHNVVALLPGSDPKLRDEYVLLTAHWDHLGRNPSLAGDQIYNGAIDNAAGTAQLLEIAEALANIANRPRRSVLFLATTGEERGFLGARYYVRHPLYPLASTVAEINLDSGNVWGRTSDVNNLAYGETTLDEVFAAAARQQRRTFSEEPFAGGTYFFLSDQIEFARAGVPASFPGPGNLYVGKPTDYGDQRWGEYGAKDYHQVSDEVRADWDLSGAVEDAQWLLHAIWIVTQDERRPQWREDAEFRRR
ncbi:MAG TPA: M28 family peptidase [Thermoanaerobaculia bacterium]|nr:M28 family peptidase [Thermoanaerobaculia bacterium]